MIRSNVMLTGAVLLVLGSAAAAQYDPPPGYYAPAVGTGQALAEALHDIIDGHVMRSYGDARFALQLLDQDPDNPDHIILIYSGASIFGEWDQAATWNREHQWPRSLGVGSSGPDDSDLFNLRPANPGVNNSRANLPYGIGPGYWDPQALALPGVNDRGDCSRAMFYMAVRYDGSDFSTSDLELVDGLPGANQMGDLSRMLEWHFNDAVDDIERRRNHLIWSNADNPQYWQGNRNPFIDHPEFVWAIWGTSDNDATLYVGDELPGDGASAASVDMRAVLGADPGPVIVTLHKAGSTPTTYDVLADGDAELFSDSFGRAFPAGAGDADIAVSWPDTAVVGSYAATLTVDNTDLTSAAAGQGAADAADVVSVTAAVLDHAEASFAASLDQDAVVLDFGVVAPGAEVPPIAFDIHNLEATPGLTAALRVVGTQGSGDTAALTTDLAAVGAIPAGHSQTFTAAFEAASEGLYAATYTIGVADEILPGAHSGTPLTLTLLGEVSAAACGGAAACADGDGDGVRDDNCVWWACQQGGCVGTDIVFADLGGQFGACPPDGVADANDRFHALNCFSNTDSQGGVGYPCEPAPPQSYNVDAGGPFGDCVADGVCDGNDAFHALNAFDGSTSCSCPSGPSPGGWGPPPAAVAAGLVLEAAVETVHPGDVVEIDVFLERGLQDLRGYQLHLAATAGAHIAELLDIAVQPRRGHAFAGLGYWSAFNVDTAQMVAGLDGPGIAVPAGAYLATFTYRVPADATDTLVIEIHGGPAGRTFLFPTPARGRIVVQRPAAAELAVTSKSAAARSGRGRPPGRRASR